MGRVAGVTSEETRRRVLEAAAGVFSDCGFEGARMARIAEAAGLSVGAIYNHYESKAELLAAVVERHGAEDLSRILASGRPVGVLDLVAGRGHTLDAGPPLAPLLAELILAARRDPEVAAVLVREVTGREQILAEFVRRAQVDGTVDPDVDPAVVARFSFMLVLGSILIRTLDLPSTDQAAWGSFIDRMVDQFRTEKTP